MAYTPSRRRRSRFVIFSLFQNLTPQKLVLYGVVALIGLAVMGYLLTFVAFAWYARDLPSPGKLSQSRDASTVYLDREGKVLYEMYKDKIGFRFFSKTFQNI
jgi:membrane peptidoglycan carboxypeptidase